MSDQFEPAPHPINEFARAMRAKATGLMDAEPSTQFTHFATWARSTANCAGAYISLLDDTQQKILGVDFGDHEDRAVPEADRSRTLSQYALLSYQPKIVPDLREHPILKSHPLVKGHAAWVFWAAFPLITKDGLVLGAMTVVDYKPQNLPQDSIDELQLIAGKISDLINSIGVEAQHCLRDGNPVPMGSAE